MTQEEKARAYDKAIEKIKYVMEHGVSPVLNKEDLQDIFPELKESEDERIRKDIIHLVTKSHEYGGYALHKEEADKMLAWLEKQGDEKEYTFNSIPRLLEMVEPTERAKAYCQKLIDALTKEGYVIDAKIVGECLKKMNGEKVALATMDDQKINKSEDERIREAQLDYWRSVGGKEWHGVLVQDAIAWLEKQGKKKENSNHYEGWINIYKHEYGYTLSREMCNTCEEARKYWNKNTVATIKIEWEEQQ